MIPKIIHYCWFGGKNIPDSLQHCIDSWKTYCGTWKIVRWDESNSPIDNKYVKDAYHHKKFAYVSDYVRFHALYSHGGVYLDTDMLLLKPLDPLLNCKIFMGMCDFESVGLGIIGAEKGNDWCLQCKKIYNYEQFDMVSPIVNTTLITRELYKYGFMEKNTTQLLSNGIQLYPSDFFYPIPPQSFVEDISPYNSCLTPSTYAVHLWNGSWVSELTKLSNGQYKEGFSLAFKRIIHTPFLPLKYYKKLFKYFLVFLHLFPHDR